MLNRLRLSVFATLMFLFAVSAYGQTQPVVPPSLPNPAMAPAAGRIYLDVSVDKSGQAATGLQQQDFTLLDNKEPRTIASFAAVTGRDAKIQVIVVMDAVNATLQNVIFQRQQLEQYLRAEGGNLSYPMVIVVLTDDGLHAVTGQFTTDGNALSAALDQDQVGFRAIQRSAGYYGASERFQICVSAMYSVVASVAKHQGRKIIIWISPGWPLLSGPEVMLDDKQEKRIFDNVVDLSTVMSKAQITLYSIDPLGAAGAPLADWTYGQFVKGITKSNQATYGDLGLPVLVTQSGGIAFGSTNGIADRVRQCLSNAVPYYEIGFDPPATDKKNEYHQLQVKVAGGGLKVHTRMGYYADPASLMNSNR
jgi:VWFA-related protein